MKKKLIAALILGALLVALTATAAWAPVGAKRGAPVATVVL